MKLINAIAKRVEDLIQEQEGLTQYALAKKAGIPRATIWKVIHPDTTQVKTVKLDTLYQIIDTLGLKLKDFFDDPIFDEVTD